ncbi:hypothetical protein AMS68_000411 [Peltaster fructicola]|uniref:Transcription factor domain-containing protein n=1 Tax=Peltaster fructicola TaxID=286661 RepID=A0A6H0XJJ8_9PEZI|nr:hypothetical protein AMS68_000411 [Peltaster fructicola]
MKQQKQKHLADLFILCDTPGQPQTQETRKRIRSRAAKHSHDAGRRSGNRATRTAQPVKLVKKRVDPAVLQHSRRSSDTSLILALDDDDYRSWTAQSCNAVGSFVGDGLSFPVPEQAFFRPTIDFMWKWMSDAWTVFDATENERTEALTWVQRLTWTSPPYFCMNMLSACTTLAALGRLDAKILPLLTMQTVRAINEALSDPTRMLDIGVILTVGRIALRECMRGDFETGHRVHRPAQARLLAMAGGLESLSLPTLVRKHVMWAERLVCQRTGVSLAELDPRAIRQDAMLLDSSKDLPMLSTYYMHNKQALRTSGVEVNSR